MQSTVLDIVHKKLWSLSFIQTPVGLCASTEHKTKTKTKTKQNKLQKQKQTLKQDQHVDHFSRSMSSFEPRVIFSR